MADDASGRMEHSEAPDVAALVRRGRDGHRDAFTVLYERYRRSVFGCFQHMGLNSQESWSLTPDILTCGGNSLHLQWFCDGCCPCRPS
jgi:hypothetical protein